jgi:hypothetical protein
VWHLVIDAQNQGRFLLPRQLRDRVANPRRALLLEHAVGRGFGTAIDVPAFFNRFCAQ